MATKNVLSVSSGSIDCDLACEIVGDTGGKDIYIGDSTYIMYVTIRNEGSTTYRLTGKQPDGTTNAHFELNFSAHILLAGEYEQITYPRSTPPADWAVTPQTVTDTDYITNLYLFYTGSTPLTLSPNGTLVIPIQYRTDTESDAETCRITVKPGDDSALWSPLPGCAAGMQVTEDVTPYTFQLTAFVVGGDTLLNDGETENAFTLRLFNPTTTPILLQPNTTAFEISIDTTNDPTGLCTPIQAKDISVTTNAQGLAAPTYPSGENVPRSVWTVRTANRTTPIVIPAAGSVDFTFTNVKTALAPGRSMIYVRCVNVPSMGGQVLIASVEKSPAFPAQGTNTNINAAQLLFAPSTLTNGGAGLYIKGDPNTQASFNLLQIDGTNGHTGLSISNIGGSAHGLSVSGNTSSPVGQFTQNSTTNYSLRADGGWGVGIYGVTNQSSGLYVELSSINAGVKVVQNSTGYSADLRGGAGVSISNITGNNKGLQINQTGTGNSAIFYGGAGVSIETITGSNRGLNIAANSSGDGLKVSQQGTANSAYFTGGAGVLIDNVGTNNNGLCIRVNTSNNSALKVSQSGTNNSAYFSGGGGVKIDGVTSGNGLYLSASTASDALYINQGGAGHALKIETSSTNQALYVTQSNTSGMAAKFSGKVEIDGDVVIKGKIYLESDINNIVVLRNGSLHNGPTLFLERNGGGSANISVLDAQIGSRAYWVSSSGSGSDNYIYYQSNKGLTIDQHHGPDGVIQAKS